jgi:hypothetical protein
VYCMAVSGAGEERLCRQGVLLVPKSALKSSDEV